MRILHLLQYPIKHIIPNLDNIKEQGYDYIQISPVQPTKCESNIFWLLYQPCDFTIGNAQIGTKDDFIELCEKAHEKGLKIVVDIVLRHVASDNHNSSLPHEKVNKNLLKFIKHVPNISDYNNRFEVTNFATGTPTLDYNNQELQRIFVAFLDELKECGCDLFRLDELKHFSLDEEGGSFFKNVIDKYDNFGYGEIIYCDKDLLNKYSQHIKILTDGRCDNKDDMVVFVESHDTFLNDGDLGYTKYLCDDIIVNEYSVLCDNFPNTIFYARPFSDSYKDQRIRYANNKAIIGVVR